MKFDGSVCYARLALVAVGPEREEAVQRTGRSLRVEGGWGLGGWGVVVGVLVLGNVGVSIPVVAQVVSVEAKSVCFKTTTQF